jgi:anti-sigma B factor antagonist
LWFRGCEVVEALGIEDPEPPVSTDPAKVGIGFPPPMDRRSPMNMTTITRQVDGITVVDISGRIVLGDESAALRAVVCDLLAGGHRKILFNLGEVNYIDSSGVGHLASAVASARKLHGELKLFNVTNQIREVLQITKLHTIIEIMDNETTAIESFAKALVAAR